ncbi:retrotransposon protein, putative, ty1-copia subclass [Tanacetum coccineum]
MMNLITLPKSFWGYALESAACMLNMVPTKKVERMPYEIWHRKAPKLSYLRVWGCEALVKRDAPDKLNPRSIKCIFIRKIPQAPDRYGFYVDVEEHELGDLNKPPNYKVALSDPEFDKWLEAMNTKMQSMKDNQVWILVDLPPNGRTIGSKWFSRKRLKWMARLTKRHAFWSLNEDILKITVLTTNTPYPSRKIRRICACTHQRPRRKQDPIRRNQERQYAIFKLYENKIFWKISNVVPTPRNPQYVVSKTLDTPYRTESRPYK